MITLGFDPGGIGNFGCAILNFEDFTASVKTVSSVDEAMKWIGEVTSRSCKPQAIGIDTLMHWQTTQSGWRGADEYLKRLYPDKEIKKSIAACNSLYSAMTVQGITLATYIRKTWPDVTITETHPKLLWYELNDREYPRKQNVENVLGELNEHMRQLEIVCNELRNDHEYDALLSAWAAGKGITDNWEDIVGFKAEQQINENVYPIDRAKYYWPRKEE